MSESRVQTASDAQRWAVALARVSSLDSHLRVDPMAHPEWTRADALADPPMLAGLLETAARHRGTTERRVAASLFLAEYAWRVAAPAVASYLTTGDVPVLTPESVFVDFDGAAEPVAVAFAAGAFVASGQPPGHLAGSGRADPQCVPLRGALRSELEGHLEGLIAGVRAITGTGLHTLWAMSADAVAGAFLWAGRCAEMEQQAAREAQALLAPGDTRLTGGVRFVTIDAGGGPRVSRLRGTCCLSYRLAGTQYCAGCPLIPEAERLTRLQAALAID